MHTTVLVLGELYDHNRDVPDSDLLYICWKASCQNYKRQIIKLWSGHGIHAHGQCMHAACRQRSSTQSQALAGPWVRLELPTSS
jgi:hypothetical protein